MRQMYIIEPYTSQKRPQWDAFVDSSRNGTFLFRRGYMDYHADRFTDASLMAYDTRGHLVAILPASSHGSEIRSHGGLTYGSWLLAPSGLDAVSMLSLWNDMTDRLRRDGATALVYKPVPHIYHKAPAEEDLYALFRSGAVLTGRMVSSALRLDNPHAMGHSAADNVRRARRAGLVCGRSGRWAEFWELLSTVLRERFDASPVHTIAEIDQLRISFPDRIRLYTVESSEHNLLGGTVIYDTGRVVHTQYIASSYDGRRLGALAWLFSHIIAEERARGTAEFIDFGTSCGHDPHTINEGLIAQKSSYGARAIAYDTYTLEIC